jgi:aryl-alcohol dehydrogenase-like predicted oxidoreductase
LKQVEFASTGQTVSEFCLGTMMFGARCDEAESDRILSKALEHGVNFVDTAAMYAMGSTEEILGRC